MAFFRIGSIVLILTSALHMVGHFQGLSPKGDKQELLLDLMQNVEIPAGSGFVTMMSLYYGFSLCFALMFLWAGGSALFVSVRMMNNVRHLKTYALICTVMLAIGTSISYTYFFFAPTSCFALALVLFVISYFRLGKRKVSA